MEFKPGELPPADNPPATLTVEGERAVERKKRMGIAAWLALLSASMALVAIVVRSAVSFATRALRDGSIIDLVLLAALIVFVGSIAYLLGRQARA